jgi:hypothetical protein
VNYVITSEADLPNDHHMFFPFLPALARDDSEMVPGVISQYFFYLLGPNKMECIEMFEAIKVGWGNLKVTPWGDELAHMYSAIRLAFESGAYIRVLVNGPDYGGFVLVGAGYEVRRWETTILPAPFTEAQEHYRQASPHHGSVLRILSYLQFSDDLALQAAIPGITSARSLSKLVLEIGYNRNNEERILKEVKGLSFVADRFLPITAVNISRVLRSMAGIGEKEEEYPLHPQAILERTSEGRLLSAFGAYAPSFKVPGGRPIDLKGSFSYARNEKGKKVDTISTRIYAVVVPWKKAKEDLFSLIDDHTVLSPVGTPLANRASSKSMIREFSGDSGGMVLDGLRQVCKVVAGDTPGAGPSKRKNDEGGGEGTQKRLRKLL